MTSCTQIRGRAGWRASFRESTSSEVACLHADSFAVPAFHHLLRETQ